MENLTAGVKICLTLLIKETQSQGMLSCKRTPKLYSPMKLLGLKSKTEFKFASLHCVRKRAHQYVRQV